MNSISADAKSDTGQVYINSTYGSLTGTTNNFWNIDEKICNSYAETTKKVTKIRSQVEVQYYSTGDAIANNSSGWQYDAKQAGTQDIEMHHFKNKLTGVYDGFQNTKLAVYGTADAITGDPYVVYTKVIY